MTDVLIRLIDNPAFWALAAMGVSLLGSQLLQRMKQKHEIRLQGRKGRIDCLIKAFTFASALPNCLAEYHKELVGPVGYNYPDVIGFCDTCITHINGTLEAFIAVENKALYNDLQKLRSLCEETYAQRKETQQLNINDQWDDGFSQKLKSEIEEVVKDFSAKLHAWVVKELEAIKA